MSDNNNFLSQMMNTVFGDMIAQITGDDAGGGAVEQGAEADAEVDAEADAVDQDAEDHGPAGVDQGAREPIDIGAIFNGIIGGANNDPAVANIDNVFNGLQQHLNGAGVHFNIRNIFDQISSRMNMSMSYADLLRKADYEGLILYFEKEKLENISQSDFIQHLQHLSTNCRSQNSVNVALAVLFAVWSSQKFTESFSKILRDVVFNETRKTDFGHRGRLSRKKFIEAVAPYMDLHINVENWAKGGEESITALALFGTIGYPKFLVNSKSLHKLELDVNFIINNLYYLLPLIHQVNGRRTINNLYRIMERPLNEEQLPCYHAILKYCHICQDGRITMTAQTILQKRFDLVMPEEFWNEVELLRCSIAY